MKKLLSVLLLLCLLLPAAHAEEKIYLALGDSITTGYGLSENEKGFADLIAEKNGFALINQAVNGATTADVYALLSRKNVQEDIARADLITLTCGGNDLMGLLFSQIASAYNAIAPTPLQASEVISILSNPSDQRQMMLLGVMQTVLMGNETTKSLVDSTIMDAALTTYRISLTAVISAIRQYNPTAPIIVATQYNPFQFFTGDFLPLAQTIDKAVKKLSDAVSAQSAASGYLVADAYTAFAQGTENLCCAAMQPFNPDPHPNAQGHIVLFDCFQAVIDTLQ